MVEERVQHLEEGHEQVVQALAANTQAIAAMSTTVISVQETLEGVTQALAALTNVVISIRETLEEHARILTEHSQILREHTRMLIEHSTDLGIIKAVVLDTDGEQRDDGRQ